MSCSSSNYSSVHAWSSNTLTFPALLKFNSLSSSSSTAKRDELKAQIRTLAANTNNGINASKSTQNQIMEYVQQLEKLNPTKRNNLTSNSKLDGSWNLVYTTNGGSSAGKLGPFVGDVEQRILLSKVSTDSSVDDGYYINYVRLGGNLIEGALAANWDVLSGDTWQVNFQSLQFKIFGIKVLDTELKAQGIWRKTYLDGDFRILYASAKNDDRLEKKKSTTTSSNEVVKESIYILSRN